MWCAGHTLGLAVTQRHVPAAKFGDSLGDVLQYIIYTVDNNICKQQYIYMHDKVSRSPEPHTWMDEWVVGWW